MAEDRRLRLFEAAGIELEYMIVDRETLDVRALADHLLAREAGGITSDVEHDDITWSNELVLHVIELKTSDPARSLAPLPAQFNEHVRRVNSHLEAMVAQLLPGAMHPWMDPFKEMQLWPHEYSAVYEAFNRIFDCRGHGWANLQAMHLNLPFANDDEFGRLHAAIRLLMPIIPGFAASSPFADGARTSNKDHRLSVYATNARRVPSVSGSIIPEPVFDQQQYQEQILDRIYDDLAPHDREGLLRYEWANARGAIARFDRGSIEIRIIDMQEAPVADLAVAAAIIAVLKMIAAERWCDLNKQKSWAIAPLKEIFDAAVVDAENARVINEGYLRGFGWTRGPCTIGELWRHLIHAAQQHENAVVQPFLSHLDCVLSRGTLATRLVRRAGRDINRQKLHEIYRELSECLAAGVMFDGCGD